MRIMLSWVAMLAFTLPFALMLLVAIPTGGIIAICVHAALLVIGAALVLALEPNEHE